MASRRRRGMLGAMDTITQGVLGAAFGKAAAGPKLGRRAAWWGAFGGVLPDFDLVASLWGPWAELEHHRGVTHALWFGPVVGTLLGYAIHRVYRRTYDPAAPDADTHPGAPSMLRPWILVLVLSIVTHPLLDVFTSYGTQLFAPFSRHRFALDAVAVVDPIYTLILSVALWFGRDARENARAALGVIAITTGYLFYTMGENARAEAYAREDLRGQGIAAAEVRAYPVLLTPWLRRLVARAPGEIRVGQVSLWAPRPVRWHLLPAPDHPLIEATRARPEGVLFEWFAMGETMARVIPEGESRIIEIEDMRYGYPRTPEQGLWGIRARYGPAGTAEGPITWFERPLPERTLSDVWLLLRITFAPE